jgi:hypothetical protein
MDKISIKLVLTMEEVDRLLQKLDMLGDDPDSRHLQQRIFSQQYPPEATIPIQSPTLTDEQKAESLGRTILQVQKLQQS